jgi:hypothetical protein
MDCWQIVGEPPRQVDVGDRAAFQEGSFSYLFLEALEERRWWSRSFPDSTFVLYFLNIETPPPGYRYPGCFIPAHGYMNSSSKCIAGERAWNSTGCSIDRLEMPR